MYKAAVNESEDTPNILLIIRRKQHWYEDKISAYSGKSTYRRNVAYYNRPDLGIYLIYNF